jgi:hypothetical protein
MPDETVLLDEELLRAIARFESGTGYTPEEKAEIEIQEAKINAQLRKYAETEREILALSKVHGANKVYR